MTLPDVNHQVIAPADVYRAEGLLAGRLGLDVAAAAEVLQREAASREATVLDVAREVLSGDCSLGTTVLDPWGSC